MYELCVELSFAAAHQLRGYKGKCENMHGHNWKVHMRAKSAVLNNIGLAMDFGDLKRISRDVLGMLDHKLLNEVPPFDRINPSSENLAKWIFESMAGRLAGESVSMSSVTVWESDTASATYHAE